MLILHIWHLNGDNLGKLHFCFERRQTIFKNLNFMMKNVETYACQRAESNSTFLSIDLDNFHNKCTLDGN